VFPSLQLFGDAVRRVAAEKMLVNFATSQRGIPAESAEETHLFEF